MITSNMFQDTLHGSRPDCREAAQPLRRVSSSSSASALHLRSGCNHEIREQSPASSPVHRTIGPSEHDGTAGIQRKIKTNKQHWIQALNMHFCVCVGESKRVCGRVSTYSIFISFKSSLALGCHGNAGEDEGWMGGGDVNTHGHCSFLQRLSV